MQSVRDSVRDVVIGIVVGIAAMLPGISGATLSVSLGIYERLVRDLANLRTWLMKDFRFLFLLILGAAIGTVLSAKILNGLINDYPAECLLLFLGLIAGSVPSLWHQVEHHEGPATNGTIAFIIGFGIIIAMILADAFLTGDSENVVSHDAFGFLVMVVVGVVVGVSAITPGLSHSTVLIVLGLFGTFTGAIANADVFFLSALVIGVAIGLIAFSKVLHRAFDRHHHVMFMGTLGLTAGSMVSVIVIAMPHLDSPVHIIVSFVLLIAGTVVSAKFMRAE